MLDYRKRAEQYAQEIGSLGRRHVLIGNLRLGVGIFFLIATYFVFSKELGITGYLGMASLLGGFLFMVNLPKQLCR